MTQQFKKGILLALLTALISGTSIFYNKLVVVKGIDPLVFNIIKNGGVAIILSVLIFSSSKRNLLQQISPSNLKKLLLIGIIGGSIPFVLYFEGLRSVAATNANLIHKSLFIWVTAMAIPLLGERVSTWQGVGYILVAASNLLIGGFSAFTASPAEFMILAATIFWSVEYIIAKKTLRSVDSTIVAWARMFVGSIVLIIIAQVSGKMPLLFQITAEQLRMIFPSVVLLTAFVTSLYKALKFAPATVVTAVLILATPITNIFTVLFMNQPIPQVQITSGIITLAGIFLISLFVPKLTKDHAQKATRPSLN